MPYTYTFEDIRNRPVAVIGAGTLGRRIALMFATRGGTARIYARRGGQLASATQYVAETLPKVLKDRGSGEVGVATAAGSLVEALDGAWLAIESVPEKLDIKIPLWGLCNMHFYMPPEFNAVDLMSDGETNRGLLDTLLNVLPEFGVYPFEARRECTGFIFNRVWAAIKRESLALVAEGVARPEDIDGMFKVNWRVPAGPFQLMDQVGLDIVLDIENHYAEEFPYLPKHVRELLQAYVDAGKLGVKTGEGFYTYPKS